jgi:excisionase family DNA binding protein
MNRRAPCTEPPADGAAKGAPKYLRYRALWAHLNAPSAPAARLASAGPLARSLTGEYLTVRGLREECEATYGVRLAARTVQNWVRRSGLPAIKLGGRLLIHRAQFEAWLVRVRPACTRVPAGTPAADPTSFALATLAACLEAGKRGRLDCELYAADELHRAGRVDARGAAETRRPAAAERQWPSLSG